MEEVTRKLELCQLGQPFLPNHPPSGISGTTAPPGPSGSNYQYPIVLDNVDNDDHISVGQASDTEDHLASSRYAPKSYTFDNPEVASALRDIIPVNPNGLLRAVHLISAEVWSQILSLVNDKDLKSVNYKDLKSVIVANFPGASQQAVRLVWKEITPENNKLVVLYHKAEQHPQALANHIHSLTMTFEAPVLHAIEEFEISCSCDEHITELVEVRRGCYEAGDT
ncbi:hypothetical protein KCU71_g502, partial [Aureobasidium melanogenum]